MLGHVAYWLEQVPPELPNRLQGRRTPGPDVDGENSREAQRGLTRSARDVIQRLDAAYKGVVDAVSALPSDRDVPFLALRLVVGETYGHFSEHLGEIEAVLPQTSDQFVERADLEAVPRSDSRARARGSHGEDIERMDLQRCRRARGRMDGADGPRDADEGILDRLDQGDDPGVQRGLRADTRPRRS